MEASGELGVCEREESRGGPEGAGVLAGQGLHVLAGIPRTSPRESGREGFLQEEGRADPPGRLRLRGPVVSWSPPWSAGLGGQMNLD